MADKLLWAVPCCFYQVPRWFHHMFVAAAPDELSSDSNWFVKVVQSKCISNKNLQMITAIQFLQDSNHSLEQVETTKSS